MGSIFFQIFLFVYLIIIIIGTLIYYIDSNFRIPIRRLNRKIICYIKREQKKEWYYENPTCIRTGYISSKKFLEILKAETIFLKQLAVKIKKQKKILKCRQKLEKIQSIENERRTRKEQEKLRNDKVALAKELEFIKKEIQRIYFSDDKDKKIQRIHFSDDEDKE